MIRFYANNIIDKGFSGTSGLAPLKLEARSAIQTSLVVSSSAGIVASSPKSISAAGAAALKGIPLSRSTSDGYDASGKIVTAFQPGLFRDLQIGMVLFSVLVGM
ncbi:unnamed protein product [Lupinus luteus]|uniref:Uncharacterized protein n=1 Tax=Lupinus luteus TaxID=3873 RepID=A0AAV1WGC3_LUPLU